MQLIAINTSLAKPVAYQAETLLTGIFKVPAKGPVLVSTNNLQGDQQADRVNHGGKHKAVYGFGLQHYDYWRQALDNSALQPGAFGENLTISDFHESELYIGDQLRIGDCILQISQPRVPCFKLGIALNNTRAPRLFTRHFCTGAYLRVIKEGMIQAGDEVIRTQRAVNSISVLQLFRAYFDKNFGDTGQIFARALAIDALSPEWRHKITDRLASASAPH
jgi:MOSC domain-containing protein YiiM